MRDSSIWGVRAELRMPTHKGRVPGLQVVLPGWGDPCANFLGSGAVVYWGFGVWCSRVKLVSSSLGSILGVSAELRMPTHKGRVPGLPIVLPGWGDPSPNFLCSCGISSDSQSCMSRNTVSNQFTMYISMCC